MFRRSVLAFAEAREPAALQRPDAWSQSKPLATIYLWISPGDHFLAVREPGKKPKELSIHSGVNSDDRVWSWLPLSSVAARAGRDQVPPSPASIGVKLFSITALRPASSFRKHGNGRHIHGTGFFRVQLRPRIALANPVGRMSLQVLSRCPLQNIGTKLVLKSLWRASIRGNSAWKFPPASTVHYCTLSRIMLFLRYCVCPSSAGPGESSSLQQKSEFEKSCVQREIVP